VIARDHAWFRATSNLSMRLYGVLYARSWKRMNLPAEKAAVSASIRARLHLRLLIATLALRAYRLDHGSDPKGMAALVPGYLSAIPRDPADGKPFLTRGEPGGGRTIDLGLLGGADDDGTSSESHPRQPESGGEGEGQQPGDGQQGADGGAFGQRG